MRKRGCHGYSPSTTCQLGPRPARESVHLAARRRRKLPLSDSSNTLRICGIRSLGWVPGMMEPGSGLRAPGSGPVFIPVTQDHGAASSLSLILECWAFWSEALKQ
ncbi:hypothetical protein EYF80_014904 [Liparis tanakae]|uniref:Uncharacterized protein n=1 Tax=Liparis tanakae TaxID=230148 RepID=A0A4Z2IBT6_9TELE|nr:hypothetical protein EYF80_014904 [Liparis tanakae]